MLGAITGDIVGSIYEFNNIKTTEFEFFQPKCFFTDDTVLTVSLADVILNKRNDVIVNKILTSEDKKIIATYWLLHFAGIFDKLQAADIRWRIIKIDYLYPIK